MSQWLLQDAAIRITWRNPMAYTTGGADHRGGAGHTIAEMPEFIKRADRLLKVVERQALIVHLAERPQAGVLIQGTGGIRKLRWAREGMGKSRGVRVIYFYLDERMPLYLLTVFGKSEKADLSGAERGELARIVNLLIQSGLKL